MGKNGWRKPAISVFRMCLGYKDVFLKIFAFQKNASRGAFHGVEQHLPDCNHQFFSLYITERLHLPDNLVAVFPVIRTIVMLLFLIGLQNLINRLRMKGLYPGWLYCLYF